MKEKTEGDQRAVEANSAEFTYAFTEEQNECENEKETSDQAIMGLTQTVNQLELELSARKNEILKLQENRYLKKVRFGFKEMKKSNSTEKFFTGLPTLGVFLWVVSLIRDKVKKCSMALSVEDHTLIVLMKLKFGLINKDIAFRYGCTESMTPKVFRKWLPGLPMALRNLIVWPSRTEVRINLPRSFKRKYRDCICIIDCSEVLIERPRNLTARAQTWSNYKHNNTIKYLIGISPAGAVTFLSEGWGGRVPDKKITMESGFLNELHPGDCVLADRGFAIHDELATRSAFLQIPKFTRGKSQTSGKDVHQSGQLSNVRIHVARVIGQLKKFKILQCTLPISHIDLINDIMVVVSAIANLNSSFVNK